MTFEQRCYAAWKDEQDEIKRVNMLLKEHETPDNLSIKELEDFLYLRACLYMDVKPTGNFEGNARICAEVMQQSKSIVDMHRTGANSIYCACLSQHGLDEDVQRDIINAHIQF